MRLITGLVILTFFFYSCNPKESRSSKNSELTSQLQPTKTGKPLIQIDRLLTNEGYNNIPLNIVAQTSQDGYLVNKIQAMSKSDTLELIVSLKEGIPAGDEGSGNGLLTDGIIFESTGTKSDRLLTALAQKYQLNSGKLTMKSKQAFTCANLNDAPVDYQSGTPKFKIFIGNKQEVAELYVNFDFKKSIVFLNEKDPQYRDALLNLLKE